MSRLTWIERDHGWRAGPYEIELAAPELWVCTRRLRSGEVEVEMTSGSLSALKTSMEQRDARRQSRRRGLMYLAGFLLAMFMVGVAATAGWSATPFLVIVFSSIGLMAAVKSVDCVIRRSWESIPLHYQ